ncbi:hypothetical protein ABH994_007025 [Bradyrhizobium yuanmingense]|uniref:hypothetical protein n=1 Tax=Bradyrhizobium yuanmingense TaxID=108015 RepID=UPI0035123804
MPVPNRATTRSAFSFCLNYLVADAMVGLIAQDKGAPWVRPRVDARTSLRQGDQKQKAPPKVASSFVTKDYNFLTESGAGTGMREQQRSSA